MFFNDQYDDQKTSRSIPSSKLDLWVAELQDYNTSPSQCGQIKNNTDSTVVTKVKFIQVLLL